jgi:hypothetical protein
MPCEPDLIVLRQHLVSEQDDEVLMPGGYDRRECVRRYLVAQIDPYNFRAERWRQRSHF